MQPGSTKTRIQVCLKPSHLTYPAVLKAWPPCCPLSQSESLQQLSPVNFQLQSLCVRALPLCLLPAPCHVALCLPLDCLLVSWLPITLAPHSLSAQNSPTSGGFLWILCINIHCMVFYQECDKAYKDRCNSQTIKYELIRAAFPAQLHSS